MVDFRILKKFGSTNERWREFFTCVLPDGHNASLENLSDEEKKKIERIKRDIELRDKFQKKVQQRLQEHIVFSLKNYSLSAAADLAWDSPPINKASLPLILYAQGKIKIEQCVKQLSDLGCVDQFTKKNDKGEIKEIDLPRFFDFSVNLVRSVTTRRLAAQSNRYNNLWPYFKFESRSTGLIGKLRADVLSQRVDIMADQYDYRHHDTQVYRDSFLYGHSVDFPRASWETEKQWCFKSGVNARAPEFTALTDDDIEAVIVKEGLCFLNPHPSRVFWDNAYPLASINSDSGCEYIGFWDVCRYRDIAHNPCYFNRESIPFSSNLWGYCAQYQDYFNQYLNTIKPPPKTEVDLAAENNRLMNIGVYSGELLDSSVFKAEYYEKVIPKAMGIGDYPFPVWVRFTFASDNTCIFAEFMPSTPAAVCSFNENDSRQVNISPAHEIMPFQDQMSNLATQMLLMVEAELLKIITLNTDVLTAEQVKYIRSRLQGKNYSSTPLTVEHSASKARDNGLDPNEVVKIHETRVSATITAVFQAMAQLINLMERILALSPAEQGQPAPREISATEVNEIASTTQSVYSFISDSIDEFRAAKKRILYESLLCCGQQEFQAPVANRYPLHIIEKAGFRIVPDTAEDGPSPLQRHTLIGSKYALKHEYIFTSRDGAERGSNTQAANTLVQLVAQVVNFPPVLEAMGREKLYEIFNEIFRLSGSGVDLNLELQPGEDNSFGPTEIDQLKQIVEQLAQAVKQDAEEMAVLKQTVPGLADAVKRNAEEIQRILQRLTPQQLNSN